MRIRMPARTMLDALMALLFLLLMADRHTGNAAHELMGLLLAGLALLHARLNARWYGALGGGFRTPHRAVLSLANLALLAAFIGTLASAIPIPARCSASWAFTGACPTENCISFLPTGALFSRECTTDSTGNA